MSRVVERPEARVYCMTRGEVVNESGSGETRGPCLLYNRGRGRDNYMAIDVL